MVIYKWIVTLWKEQLLWELKVDISVVVSQSIHNFIGREATGDGWMVQERGQRSNTDQGAWLLSQLLIFPLSRCCLKLEPSLWLCGTLAVGFEKGSNRQRPRCLKRALPGWVDCISLATSHLSCEFGLTKSWHICPEICSRCQQTASFWLAAISPLSPLTKNQKPVTKEGDLGLDYRTGICPQDRIIYVYIYTRQTYIGPYSTPRNTLYYVILYLNIFIILNILVLMSLFVQMSVLFIYAL